MKRLNTLRGREFGHNWCGPSALSIITGRTVDYCARLCAEKSRTTRHWVSRQHTAQSIKGVYNSEMFFALTKMGFEYREVMGIKGKTLNQYMAERGGEQWKGVMLINVTRHYVVVNRDIVSDNHQQDKHYTDHTMKRRKIERAWIITRRKKS